MSLDRGLSNRKLTEAECDTALGRIRFTTDMGESTASNQPPSLLPKARILDSSRVRVVAVRLTVEVLPGRFSLAVYTHARPRRKVWRGSILRTAGGSVSPAAGNPVASPWTSLICCALVTDDPRMRPNPYDLGRVFNEVPELYDRVRPGYPDELFADLATVTGMDEGSSVLEVGCGTGQATRSLAALGCSVTAVEPGAGMAALARRRLASFRNVEVETSTFEEWDDHGRRFDVLVAASSWHWVDPSIGWQRAHDVLRPGGWMALLGHVVVRRPGEPEVYAETADLHERFCPGNPDWGHPPLEEDVRTTDEGWGLVDDPGELFGPTIVRWYPTVQWFDGDGFADLLRSTSLYRRLDRDIREPLLDAIAERIRTRMGDRAPRRYLSVLRVGQRAE